MQEAGWPAAPCLENHWHWRPEWHQNRACLLWYLTFEDQSELTERAVQVEGALRDSGKVDVVPSEWLHLTLDDVAYEDHLSPDRVEALVETAREAVADCFMPPLELGPVVAMADAIVLQAGPHPAITRLRDRLHAVSEAVVGRDNETSSPDFWPHVSLGYVNDACAEHLIMEPLNAVAKDPFQTSVSRLTLASVTRKNRHYQWTSRAVLTLPHDARGTGTSEAEKSHAS